MYAALASVDKRLGNEAKNLLYSHILCLKRNWLRSRSFLLNTQAQAILPANDRILRNIARVRNTG